MKTSLLALAALVLFGLFLRPPIPLDETRYLAVAWEMHSADAWLVPRLDGVAYHHKPPLLFWLIRVGWEIFGVHAWWPRLLPALAAFGCLFGCRRLAQRLAHADDLPLATARAAGERAFVLLAACLAWSIYSGMLLFDLLIAAWVLLGLHSLLDREQRPVRAVLGLALAVGLGALTKGPVILLYLVPAAVFLPLPQAMRMGLRLRFAATSLLGVLLGAGLALAWALPAAAAGGEEYGNALLYGQTAGRIQQSFSHARPIWWYLPIGFLLLLPWSCSPAWWRSWRGLSRHPRALLAASLFSFAGFSLISGKQPHYLVPLLPALFAATANRLPRLGRWRAASWAMPLATASILLGAWFVKGTAFDLRPAAAQIVAAQQQASPTAFLGDSHGQLHFLGRLHELPQRVGPGSILAWAKQRPEGTVVLIEGAAKRAGLWNDSVLEQALLRTPYRNEELAIVPAWALLPAEPDFSEAIKLATEAVEAMLKSGIGPGISVAIGYSGKVIWAQGFGYADVKEEKPVTTETLFRIGSVSKPLTAVGLMLLVQEGKLDLDADVRSFVPEFPEKRWPVTTRQLAGHLGGIRHYRGAEFLSNVNYPKVRDGLGIFAADPLIAEPGTLYSYSSYGFNLISAAMETAAEQPFLEFMQERVFEPLGLKHTLPDHAAAEVPQRTAFYQTLAGKTVPALPVDNSYKWAGGGFLSTPSDLVRFQFAVQGPGFLNESSRDEMFSSQATRDGKRTGYGIGWSVTDSDNRGKTAGHSGGSVGGSTMLDSYLRAELVVAVAINQASQPATLLARSLAQPFLKRIDAEQAKSKSDD
jgi:serine beta-lactamase-like protein LACTB, mitochondrial